MPEFTIREVVYMTVEAESAQDALDAWLNSGNDAIQTFSVEEREVLDAQGELCEVED